MAHEPLCYSDHCMGLRKCEQPAPFTLAQSSSSLLTTPSTQQHFLAELRLCCGFLPFDLVLEISGKKLCLVFHSRSCVFLPLGVHDACGAESFPWLRKGRGIPGQSEKPHMVRGSGVTTSTQLQGILSIHPSSGRMPLREKEPTSYSSNRISQTQSPQRGYCQPPRPGSRLRGKIRRAVPLLNTSTSRAPISHAPHKPGRHP